MLEARLGVGFACETSPHAHGSLWLCTTLILCMLCTLAENRPKHTLARCLVWTTISIRSITVLEARLGVGFACETSPHAHGSLWLCVSTTFTIKEGSIRGGI